MAKQQSVLPFKTGSGFMSKLVGLAVCGAALALIVHDPVESAHWAADLVGMLGQAVASLASFLRDLG